ncbi:hypothetical protein FJY71_09410 [candidate division WOR-3 bacterium]|nr:hypothetical protein [candidate division WOR-3 bacterium]
MKVFLFGALLVAGLACEGFEPLEITTPDLPDGRVGRTYLARIETEGGHDRLVIEVLSGDLPPGISFRQVDRSAELDGTPTIADTFFFTVRAREWTGGDTTEPPETVSKGFALVVEPQ